MNWERLPGETVQELAAALILMANPQGNPITPSRGDRGIDLRIRTPDGIAVYQVKKYARTLTATQARDIEKSWKTFCEEGIPTLGDVVASWTLALPWNPTHERREWLETLTEGCGFATNWMGRQQLDVLAAARPDIVDYYLGDGAERVKDLMAQAIGGGRAIRSELTGSTLLDAVRDRTLHLTQALDAVDPFYSYSFQIRDGAIPEMLGPEMEADATAAFVTYESLDADKHAVMLVRPKSPWSTWLRPIERTIGFTVEPGTAEAEAVAKFLRYGAPIDRLPFTTIRAQGPPGTEGNATGLVSIVPAGRPNADFELRILNADKEPISVQLTGGTLSSGAAGGGYRFAATDTTGVLHVEILGIDDSRELTVNLTTSGWDGKPVGRMLPLVRALRSLAPGAKIEFSVAGAAAFAAGTWPHQKPILALGVADWIEAIGVIQRHARRPILIPAESSEEEIRSVRRALALLSGNVLPITDDPVLIPVDSETVLPGGEPAFVAQIPLVVQIGGETIELDRKEVIYSKSVRYKPADQAGFACVIAVEPMTSRAVSAQWKPPGPGSGWQPLAATRK